ncbi:RNA polymerase II transcription elongation factor-domain-containing protein [Coniochaeta sp. 2T2.1]|nr:RNA polymerase II transcription elongation factor-domain-containing protein [Coniochaeta sp. 2T2.1]
MATSSIPAGMVDPSKAGKYPVVLSDALLGKPSKESYTGVRYNHKPDVSDPNSTTARLKQSNKDGTFNLGIDDNGNRYTYNGVRTTKDGNYVLIFDPARQVFVLHRVDSLFHMNVTRTPGNTDVESLRKQFPQLEVQSPTPSTKKNDTKTDGKATPKPTPKTDDSSTASKSGKTNKPKASALRSKPAAKRATTQKKPPTPSATPDSTKLMPPPPAPTTASDSKSSKKTAARSPESEEEDDEDDDDDGGLTIEYPGGPSPRQTQTPFGSTFVQPPVAITRRFSEFLQNDDEEEQRQQREEPPEISYTFEDAIGSDDDEMDDVKLPSPVDGRQQQATGLGLGAYGEAAEQAEVVAGDDDADGEDDDDMAADLEADLEAEFEKATGYDSESDVSEED